MAREFHMLPRLVPRTILTDGILRLQHPTKYVGMPHNPHVRLTEQQMRQVMAETGASRDYIQKVATYVPGQYMQYAGVKAFACSRAVFCLGLFRKVFWTIICITTTMPELGVSVQPQAFAKTGLGRWLTTIAREAPHTLSSRELGQRDVTPASLVRSQPLAIGNGVPYKGIWPWGSSVYRGRMGQSVAEPSALAGLEWRYATNHVQWEQQPVPLARSIVLSK